MSAYASKDGRPGALGNGGDPAASAAHIGEAYIGMMRNSMELSAEWSKRLMGCRSMPEVAEVNADCSRKAFESWMGMVSEMSSAAVSTVSPTMEHRAGPGKK